MFSYRTQTLKAIDPDLWALVQQEHLRQEQHIELIASENYTLPAVMAAQGSQLTNKNAEGYPGSRHYGGCEYVDLAEQLAIDRVRMLFGADRHGWGANVQSHSGAQANEAVFKALLNSGDTIMGPGTAAEGHLSRGIGRGLNVVHYGLNEREEIDYDEMERKAHACKPKLIIAGTSAYALRIDFERFARVARDIGALFMVDMAQYAGLIATGEYPSPLPHADIVTSTTHKSLRGPRGGFILMRPELEKAVHAAVFPGSQGGPLMHVIAAKAVAFKEALEPDFRRYQRQVMKNAVELTNTLARRGVRIVGGRTESHLILIDLRSKGLTGQEAGALLGQANISVCKHMIPNDPQIPTVTSGICVGTLALTTRGFKEADIGRIGHAIADLLDRPNDAVALAEVRARVAMLTFDFPVYAQIGA